MNNDDKSKELLDTIPSGISYTYWKKYIEADYFERKDMLKQLPLLQSLINHHETEQELWEYQVISYVQSYLDDALEISSISFDEFYKKKSE